MYTFADWYKTAWDKINVDTLVEETKKLAKEVKTLNKAVSALQPARCICCSFTACGHADCLNTVCRHALRRELACFLQALYHSADTDLGVVCVGRATPPLWYAGAQL